MLNYNGKILSEQDTPLTNDNRAFKYGDALFETIKVVDYNIIFSEDHYFRLMASMRMLRMEISMEFTLDFFEKEIKKTIEANDLKNARVRFSVYREDKGLYLPESNKTNFLIETKELKSNMKNNYEVDLFKDFYVYSGMLSTLKTNNKILNVIASVYADENGLDNCLLLNEHKYIVEAINANVFLVKGNSIVTPSLSQGCLKGIVRKKIIEIVNNEADYSIEETEISPFELQKADEVFLTNAIIGIQPITKYRKKTYTTEVSQYLRKKLSELEKLA